MCFTFDFFRICTEAGAQAYQGQIPWPRRLVPVLLMRNTRKFLDPGRNFRRFHKHDRMRRQRQRNGG